MNRYICKFLRQLTSHKVLVPLLLALVTQSVIGENESIIYSWTTNIERGLSKAEKEDKHLLIYFAGSDWCPHCQRFDEEVISAPTFQRFLDANFVPVLIDFPRTLPIKKRQMAYNERKLTQYNIRGFPTVVLLDMSGEEIYRTGYGGGGANRFVSQLAKYIPE